jgi:hypothetical protein
MPELEYILMKQTNLPYRSCRELVLKSRETLGLGKYEPWTENLQEAAMRLYVARYGPLPAKIQEMNNDADSTTLGTCSLDGSEEVTPVKRPVEQQSTNKQVSDQTKTAEIGAAGNGHAGKSKQKQKRKKIFKIVCRLLREASCKSRAATDM